MARWSSLFEDLERKLKTKTKQKTIISEQSRELNQRMCLNLKKMSLVVFTILSIDDVHF